MDAMAVKRPNTRPPITDPTITPVDGFEETLCSSVEVGDSMGEPRGVEEG